MQRQGQRGLPRGARRRPRAGRLGRASCRCASVPGEPLDDPLLRSGTPQPAYVTDWRRPGRMTRSDLATEADLPAVARLFGETFVDDPMLRWPFPPDATVEDVTMNFRDPVSRRTRPLDAIVGHRATSRARPCGFPPPQAERFLADRGADTRPDPPAHRRRRRALRRVLGLARRRTCRTNRAGSSTSSRSMPALAGRGLGRQLDRARPRLGHTARASPPSSRPADPRTCRCTSTSGSTWSMQAGSARAAGRRSGSCGRTRPSRA